MVKDVKLIIFDLDGTIVDTIYDLAAAAEHMSMKHGDYAVDVQLAKKCIGNGLKLFLSRIYNFFGIHSERFDEELAEFRRYYLDHSCVKTRLFDDTLYVLKELRKMDKQMAVATMKPYDPAVKILGHFGMMGEPKPSPWCVKLLEKQYNVNPGKILVVGDGMTDVDMAVNAGAHSVALLNGYGNRDDLLNSRAEYKLPVLGGILEIL